MACVSSEVMEVKSIPSRPGCLLYPFVLFAQPSPSIPCPGRPWPSTHWGEVTPVKLSGVPCEAAFADGLHEALPAEPLAAAVTAWSFLTFWSLFWGYTWVLSGETSQEAVSSIMYKTHVTTHAMLSSLTPPSNVPMPPHSPPIRLCHAFISCSRRSQWISSSSEVTRPTRPTASPLVRYTRRPRVRSEGSDPRGLGVRRFSRRRNTCHCAFWHVPLTWDSPPVWQAID